MAQFIPIRAMIFFSQLSNTILVWITQMFIYFQCSVNKKCSESHWANLNWSAFIMGHLVWIKTTWKQSCRNERASPGSQSYGVTSLQHFRMKDMGKGLEQWVIFYLYWEKVLHPGENGDAEWQPSSTELFQFLSLVPAKGLESKGVLHLLCLSLTVRKAAVLCPCQRQPKC